MIFDFCAFAYKKMRALFSLVLGYQFAAVDTFHFLSLSYKQQIVQCPSTCTVS